MSAKLKLTGLLVAATVCAGTLVLAGGGLRDSNRVLTFEPAPFLVKVLGKPDASPPALRKPARGVNVRIADDGYTVRNTRHAVSVNSTAAGGNWRSFSEGATRPTPFGSETVTVGPKTTEDWLTVERRQGTRTWRWRIGSHNLTPSLGPDGSVRFASGTHVAPLRIRPVSLFDARGKKITPAGLRWSLARDKRGYVLELPLDDSNLPLPYVIDPATDYGPSTLYITNAVSTTFTGATTDKLIATASGTSTYCAAGTNCPGATDGTSNGIAGAPLWQDILPNARGTLYTASPNLPVTGITGTKGWIVEGAGASSTGTIIPSGDWTFKFDTKAIATTNNANITYRVAVGMWVITTSGTSVTSVDSTVIDPTSSSALDGTNPFPGNTTQTNHTLTVSNLPQISLSSSQHLLVRFYGKKVVAGGSNARENTSFDLFVYSGTSTGTSPTTDSIAHPTAADTTAPSAPTLSSISPGSNSRTNSTTPTFKVSSYSDPDSDSGHVNFQVCSDSACTAVLTNGDFDSSTVSSGTSNVTGTPASALSLTDGTTYYWRARSEDSNNAASSFTSTSSFVYDTTVPALSSASVNGSSLTLTYGENLNTAVNPPDGSAYTVTVNGSGDSVTATGVSGAAVTLTLQNAIHANDTVTVAYAQANATANGGAKVQDQASNLVADFGATAVTNSTANVAPNVPTLSTPDVSYFNTLTPTLSAVFSDPDTQQTGKNTFQLCTGASSSAAAACSGSTTNGASWDSSSTTLANNATGSASVPGSRITVDGTYYWQARNQDNGTGTLTSNYSATRSFMVDRVVPTYSSSATNVAGTQITLTMTEAASGLDTTSTTPASAFTVNVGGSPVTVSSVSTTDTTHVVLTLASRVYGEDTITVAYSTAGLSAAQQIKDRATNALALFTAQSVTNTAPADTTKSTLAAGTTTIFADSSGGTTSSTITVTLKNRNSTNVGTSGGTVLMSTNRGSLSAVTNVGNGTYTATLTSTAVGTAHITGTLDGRSFTASADVTVSPGLVDHYAVTNTSDANIGTQTAGTSFNVKIVAQDVNNNTATAFTGTVVVSSNRTCTSGCTTSAAFTAGVLASQAVTLTQAGASSTITATKTADTETGTSNTFTLNPATLDHFALALASPQTNGSAFTGTNTLTAQDVYNNTVTTFDASANNVTITANSPLTGIVSGLHGSNVLNQAGDFTGGIANLTTLGITYTGNATAGTFTATSANGKTGSSASVTINPGALHHFAVTNTSGTNIATQTAGTGFNVKIVAQDVSNNTVTGFTGTVVVSSNRTCSSGCTTSAAFTAGVLASQAVTLTQAGASSTITATKSGGSENGTSNTFTVNPAGLDHFTFAAASPQTDGVAFTGTNTLTAQDVYGNTVTSFDASANNVTITALSPLTGTVSGLHGSNVLNQAADFTSGVANLTSLGMKYTGNAATGTFRATSATAKTGDSGSVTIAVGALDHFAVTDTGGANIGSQTAGTAFNVKVTAQDVGNNTVTGFTGTVVVSSNRTCSSGCTTSAAFTAGVLASQAVTLTQAAASSTITATKSGSSETGTSNTFTVNSAALDHFTLTLAGPQTSGSAFTGTDTLTAQDVYGNTVASFDASANNVTLTANSPLTGTVSGLHGSNVLNQAGDFSSGVANLTTLGITYTGNATAGTFTATSANGKTGTSGSVTINPGALHHFAVTNTSGTNIATQTAGTGFNVKVTAQDASNNTVTGFTGTVDLSSNRTCTSGCTTSAAFTAGVLASQAVTLTQAGASSTITATKSAGSETGTSNSFTVNPATLDHFTLTLAGPQTNGITFTGTNTLTAQDVYGNTVTSFDASANNVTLTANSPLTGTVSGLHGSNVLNQAGDFTSGVANLTTLGLTYTGNATAGTFTATSANGKTGSSASVTINPGAVDHYVVTNTSGTSIATQTAGTGFNVKIVAQDVSNNTATGFTGTADVSSNRTCSSGCTTSAAFTAGVLASQAVTLTQAGASSTITATKTGSSQTGTSNSFTVNPATLDHFALTLATPQTNGSAFTGTNTLTAQDVYNNTVTTFDASANNVTITANSPLTGIVSGLHSSNVLNQAGDFTSGVANLTTLGITYAGNATAGTFTATSANGKTGTSASVTINPGALHHFAVTNTSGTNIATQTAGSSFNVKLVAQDASNNTATGFTGTADVSSNRTCSSGCTTTAAFTAGVLASHTVTLTQSASATLTATKSAGSETGTSNTFTVNPAALDHFALTLATPQTNGSAFTGTNTLTAQDVYNNTVTSFDASANNVTLTANSPLTGTVSGLHGSNVLNQAGDFTSGVANLATLGLTYTGNATAGTFTATSANGKTGTSASVTINPGALHHFAVTTTGGANIGTQTAGSAFNVKITAQDGSNNTVTGFTGTVVVSSNRTCTSGCTTSAAFTAGVLASQAVTLTQAGASSTITATKSAGSETGTSNSFTVNPATLDHFTLTLAGPQTNGSTFTGTNTLTAQDVYGNTVTSFDASANNVTLTANSPLTGTVSGLHGSNVLNQAGDFTSGVANLTTLGLTYTGNATAGTFTATSANGKTGSSASVTINPGSVDHYVVTNTSGTSIATQTAGTGFNVKIVAQDVSNNTATGFTGTADVSSNRTCSSGCTTSAAFTAGVLASQAVTLTQAGASSTITATKTGSSQTGTSNTFTVNPATLDHFALTLATPQTNGSAFTGTNTLTAQDVYGNTVTTFDASANNVTITANSPLTGIVSGLHSSNVLNQAGDFTSGVANLTTLGITYAGNATAGTFTATSANGKTGTSASVTINPGALHHFAVTNTSGTNIATQTAGSSFNVKLVAQDVSNNTATAFTGTADLSSNRTCSSGCTTSAAFTAGVLASHALTLTQAGASSTITATKTSSSETGTSNSFTVNSAGLDHFTLTLATPQTNGSAFTGSNTLTAQDVYNNTVTSFDASANNVTITAVSPLTGTVSGLHGSNVLNQAADFTNGVANLTTLGIKYTGNATAGSFTASSANGKTGSSASVTINPGAVDHYVVTNTSGASIATQTAGTSFNIKITAQDGSNNTATGFTGTVDLSSNRTCSSGCTTSAAFTAGVLASQAVTLTQAGASSTITATKSGSSETGTSNSFTVNPATLDHFSLSLSSPQTNGSAFTGSNTLTAQDVYNNTVTGFDASANNVTLTANSPLTGTVSGLHGANVLNQAADFTNGVANLTTLGMKYTGNAAAGTFTASSANGKTGSSASVTINPGAVDHYVVTNTSGASIGTQTAGTSFNVKLVAQDVSNNTATGFTGTVDLTSNRTCSSGCTTTAAFTAGVLASHALTLTQAGSATLTATKSGSSETGTSNSFTVNPAALDHFSLALASPQTNGSAFTGSNTLTAQDVYNNTVTSFDASANNVTLTANSPLTGTVSGLHGANVLNQAADFTNGVANLATLGLTYTGNTGTGTFTAGSANGETGSSGNVAINPGALDHFTVTNTSGGNITAQTAGTAFNVKLVAQDASNNTVTGFTGTAVVSSNRTCSSGCATTAAFSAGVLSSHTLTLTQSGSATLTATKSGSSETGSSNTFTVNPATLDHFSLSLSSPQTNGSAFTATNTLTAQDVYNNTVTSFDASANNVTISAVSPLTGTVSGLHGANVLNQAADFTNGVANLTTLGLTYTGNATAGSFTASSANGKTGSSASVTINPAALHHFAVTNTSGNNIATQTAGTAFNVKLVAQDASNNTVTGFTGTADLSSNRTCSSGCTTSAAFTAGVLASHALTLTQSGSATLTATKSGSSETGTSNSFTVNPATLDHFSLSLSSPQTNGSAFTGSNTLTAQDVYNNTVTGFDASANNVTLTANSPLTGTVSGLHGANVLNQAADFTNGVANLTTLGLTYTGNAATGAFRASSANGKTGDSNDVTVNVGPLDHFAVTAASGSSIGTQTAGTSFNVKLVAQDVSNNTATGFTGTVDLTSNRTCSSGCTTTAAFTAGVLASHALTLTQAGSATLTATKSGSSETGTSNSFTVNPAALDHFSLALASPQTNGSAFTGSNTLTAQDVYNNTVTSFDASANNVTLTANSPLTGTVSGLHGANVLNQAADFTNGVANLATLGLTYTGNTGTGTFTAGSANGETGSSGNVAINPGALDHFTVTNTSGGNITAQTAGTAFNVKLVAQDASNNTVTGFTGTAVVSSNRTCSSGCATTAAFSAGVLSSHTLTLTQSGSATLTATKSGSSETGSSNSFTVNPATLDHFSLSLSSPQTNGSAFTATNTLTAQDVYNNTVTSFDASANNVTISAVSPLTGTVSGLHGANVLNQAADFTNGVANLTTLGLTYTGNATAGSFTASSANGKTGSSASVTINPGALHHFAVTNTSGNNIATQTAGTAFNVKLVAQDASNNTVTGFTGTADLSSNRTCSSGCTTSAAFTAGVLASHALTLTQSGSATLTATKSGSSETGTSNSFTVNPATLDHFSLSLSSPQTNGSAFTGSNTLTAQDVYNNTVTGFDASANNVTLTANSPLTGTVSGLHGANVLNQAADFTNGVANLTTLGLTYTGNAATGAFRASSANGKTGDSNDVTVDPGPLDHFAVTNTSGSNITAQTAGSSFNIKVTAQDASNNTATSFTGTVTLTSNRNCSGGCTTSAGFTAGVLSSQEVTLTEAGSGSTITVTKSGSSETGTSNSFTVNPATASNLVVTQQPTDATTGNPFGTQPHVAVTDQFANVRASDNSTVIHAELIAGSGPLTGTVDATASSGEATFTDLEIDTPGSGKRLRFTATGLAAADSATFSVSALPTHLEITAINPASPTAGNAFSVTVIARDDGGFNGNVSANTGVSLSLGSGNGTVGGTVTGTIPAGSSSITISGVTYTKAESGIVLTASRTSGDSLASGDSSGFTVAAASVDHFAVTDGSGSIGSQTAGASFDITLTAQDQFDNPAPSFTDTVDVSTNCAFDNGDFSTDSFTSGVFTQSVTLTHAATNCTITVTHTSGSETGTSNVFTVGPDVIDHFTIRAASTTMTAGQSKQLTIDARDAYDNPVTAYTGVHHLFFSGASSSSSPVTQPTVSDKDGVAVGFGDDTPITFANGISTVGGSMTLYRAETTTINVTDTATFDDFSFSVTVSTGAFAQFGWSLTSPQTNTVAFTGANTLTAQDAYGNTVTSFDASADDVTLTVDPSGSVSPNTLHDDEFVNGVANLAALGFTYTGGAGSRTFTATAATGESSSANDITINPGSLDHFAVTASGGGSIATQTAGTSFAVKVTAQDVSNNTSTSFAGTVTISSNRTCSAGCATTAAFTNGVLTHSVTLTQAASGSTITATGGGKNGTSNSFTVVPGALDHFLVRNASGNAIGTQTAGTSFAIKITAQDQFDNTQTGFTGTVDVTSNRTITAGGSTTGAFTSGVLTSHSVTLTQSGSSSTITATRTSGGAQTGVSNTFTVDSAALDHFAFSLTSPQTNGVAFTGTNLLTARDQFDNTVTIFDPTLDNVAITPNSPLTGAVSGLHGAGNQLIAGDFVGGVADLTALGMTYTGDATTGTFHAVSSVSNKTGDSDEIIVAAGIATHFSIASSGAQTAGSAMDITVTALDANQNIAFDYAGEIHFTSSDSQAVLPADYTFVNDIGNDDDGQHVFSVNLRTAPSQTVTVTDTSEDTITGTSSPITVSPAALDHFLVRSASGNAIGTQTAGASFAVRITAQDQFDNTQPGFTGTVDVASNRTIAAGAGTTASFTSGVLTAHSLTLTQSGSNSTITVTKTGGGQTGSSNTFTVNPAAAAALRMTSVPATDVAAGTEFAVGVESRDAFGNTAPVSADTLLQLTPSGAGTIGGNIATLSAGASSTTLTTVTYTKAGSLTLVAHRTSGDSLADSPSSTPITIVADSLDHFLVQNSSGSPVGMQVAGVGFAVKVTAEDRFANTQTGFSGTVVISSNRTCSAGCATTASFTSGVLSSHSVTLTQAGSASTVTATDSGKTGTSNAFTVDPAAATHYDVSAASPQTAGSAFDVTVTALDAFENVALQHTGTIHFTSDDGQAVLPGNYAFVSGDSGAHLFSLTLKTAGSHTITATNTVTSSINGTSNSITINPGAASRFVVTGSSLQAAGTAQQVTVTARDAFGNTAAGYTGDKSIIFSGAGASPNATLPTATSKTGTAVEFGSPTTITFTNGVSSAGGSMKLYKSEIANIVAAEGGITTTGARRLTVTVTGGTAATAASTISANPATLTADGSSTSALTVQLEDGYGNDVTTSGGTVTLSTSKGTIGSSCTANCATVDQDDGTYTATFTAGTSYGTALITAKLNGAAFTNTASVLLLSSNLSLSASTITADPTSITADGSSTSTVTVQLKDALGADLTESQGTVTLTTTRGSLSAVTDNDDGTYTATLTSSTSAGTATVTGKLSGADLADTAAVSLTAGTPTKYLVSVSNHSPVAGDDVTVTAQLADANDNPVSTAGVPVNWSKTGSGGLLSPPTSDTNSNGVATVTFTTATTAGASYTVTADDDTLQGTTAPFTSVPGSASAATSTIMPSAASIVANGSSTSTLTVQLKDANGNDLTAGGGTVAPATSLGTLGSVTNHADGTYTATLTSGLVSGTAHVTATLNGSTLAHAADVSFTPGAPAKFLVASSSLTPVAGNNVTVTAQLADANGNAVSDPSHTATWSKSCGGGSFAPDSSSTNGSGVATVTFTTPVSVGSCTITATEGSLTGTSPSIASIPGSASAVTSTISASPTTITANGSSTSTITVRLKDSNGNDLVSSGGTVVISKQSGTGTLGDTTDNGNGTYTTTLTAPTVVGNATIDGTLNGAAITTGNANVAFAAGSLSLAHSTLGCNPSTITANGSSTSTCTLQLRDAFGNALASGQGTATMSTTLGSLSAVTDNGDGSYTATLRSSTSNGTAGLSATLNGSSVANTASVNFVGAAVPDPPQVLSVTPEDGSIVASTTQIALTADHSVTWRDLTVTKNGGTPTSVAGGTGVSIVRDFTSAGTGLYVIRVTMDDGVNTPVSAVSHFTVPSSTGFDAPAVQKNVDPDHTTVLSTNNLPTSPGSIVTVTLPPLGLIDPLVLQIAPKAVPAGFGGGLNVDVKVYRSDGSLFTDFSKDPIELRFDNVSSNSVPYTSSDGAAWTKIASTSSRSLPDNLSTGAFRTGQTVYIETRHPAYFALLKPKAVQTKLAMSIAAASTFRPASSHNVFTIRATATMAASVKGDLYDAKNHHVYTWHFKVKAGANVVKLKWPSKGRGTGAYKLIWRAQSKGQVTKTTTRVRLR